MRRTDGKAIPEKEVARTFVDADVGLLKDHVNLQEKKLAEQAKQMQEMEKRIKALLSSALLGMHPQFRQVPPSRSADSTRAVFRPCWAALIAAT